MAIAIDKFKATWDFRGHRGLVQVKGSDGEPQSFRVNDPNEFSAAVDLLRGGSQAFVDGQKIFIGDTDFE